MRAVEVVRAVALELGQPGGAETGVEGDLVASWYGNELPMRPAPMIAMDSGAIGVVVVVLMRSRALH